MIDQDKETRRRAPTLKTVADQAEVPLLAAYHALAHTGKVDEATQLHVRHVASELGYSLRVTIRDVAALAKVSVSTVSYVVNASPLIHPVTRRQVEEAIRALGYRPNSTARNLRASETRLIGYAWHRIQDEIQRNPILDRFLYEMAQAVEAEGYHVLTFAQSSMQEGKSYESLIRSRRVDGFMLSDTSYDDPRIQTLRNLRFPFAAFGRANPDWDFPCVDDDGQRGIGEVIEHLLAQGHTHITMLSWPDSIVVGDVRMQGYREAMQAGGIEPRPDWIVHTLNDVAHAREATRHIMSSDDLPTAIVCATDFMAIGVKLELESRGIVLGQDIAVTGYDDSPVAESLGLTSVRQRIDAIARTASDLLLAEVRGQRLPDHRILIAPQVIVRSSSHASRRASDPALFSA